MAISYTRFFLMVAVIDTLAAALAVSMMDYSNMGVLGIAGGVWCWHVLIAFMVYFTENRMLKENK